MYKIFISRLTLCYAVVLIGVGIVLDFVLQLLAKAVRMIR